MIAGWTRKDAPATICIPGPVRLPMHGRGGNHLQLRLIKTLKIPFFWLSIGFRSSWRFNSWRWRRGGFLLRKKLGWSSKFTTCHRGWIKLVCHCPTACITTLVFPYLHMSRCIRSKLALSFMWRIWFLHRLLNVHKLTCTYLLPRARP